MKSQNDFCSAYLKLNIKFQPNTKVNTDLIDFRILTYIALYKYRQIYIVSINTSKNCKGHESTVLLLLFLFC